MTPIASSSPASTGEAIFTNARLVLETEIVSGTIVLRDGVIADIAAGRSAAPGVTDCEGDFLAPGLIELHTDNLERHIAPRPGVDWPHASAIFAHDAELASQGITTVFDALRVGSTTADGGGRRGRYARDLASELLGLRDRGALRLSHFLHLRAEICSETLAVELAEFVPADRVGIVSLMDHTPGQRQFADLGQLRTYLRGKYALSEPEFEAHVERQSALGDRVRAAHEAAAVEAARRLGAVLASHDDTNAAHVAASRRHGVRIAEFPTTLAAAEACRAAGIEIIMGAPNLIRGGSHSGNVAARDLAARGLLDILSSDYIPAALLMGAVRLGEMSGSIPAGIRTVTIHPAQAAGLDDRGALRPGLRADLVRFRLVGGVPTVMSCHVKGRRVA